MPETKSWKEHQGEVADSVNGFDVVECQTCGFKHIVPIPTTEELKGLYHEDYYSKEKPLYFERHREDIEWWNMVYAERYEFFEQHLPPTRRRILDIGSGPGFFLKLGKERGWETVGIEPSQQAAEHARGLGLEIVNEFFTEDNVDSFSTFDVVHMHEVLEHIPDPARMLRLAYRLLNAKGLLCVIVPSDYNPLQKVLREHLGYEPWWVAPPHHINYFDFDSLERLVQCTGFKVVHKTATFPMELFLLMGDNYVGNDSLGRTCHGRRKKLELNLKLGKLDALKRALYATLAEYGIGREIVMLAKKV
jgi:SAM-dependent methyltransferase